MRLPIHYTNNELQVNRYKLNLHNLTLYAMMEVPYYMLAYCVIGIIETALYLKSSKVISILKSDSKPQDQPPAESTCRFSARVTAGIDVKKIAENKTKKLSIFIRSLKMFLSQILILEITLYSCHGYIHTSDESSVRRSYFQAFERIFIITSLKNLLSDSWRVVWFNISIIYPKDIPAGIKDGPSYKACLKEHLKKYDYSKKRTYVTANIVDKNFREWFQSGIKEEKMDYLIPRYHRLVSL